MGGLFVVALITTVLNTRGAFVADSRFDQFWAPWRGVQDHAWAWSSGQGGLGLPTEDFWLVPALLLGALRGVGASPALAERVWHSLLLASAGAGAIAVLRLFRPRVGLEHVVAGALYTFNPYTVTFLIHSFLFLNYALAPWLLVAFVHGVRGNRPWRWAAVFALLVFAAGNLDVPGVVYACVPLLPTAAYLVHVERSIRWRRVVGWLARAGVLVAGVSAAAIHVLLLARASLTQRLVSTEDPSAVNVVSSWAESWRGLGFWLSYFSGTQGPSRPGEAVFYTNPVVVVATFLAPLGALVALYRTRWRPRVLFASLMLVSLVLMVGAFPVDEPSPIGRLIRGSYRNVVALSSLRNSYKAGAGLLLGTAVLVGVGVAVLAARWRGRRRHLTVLALVVTTAAATASAPFWTGDLYTQRRSIRGVPGYWQEAFAWLNAQPNDQRVLVVPGSSVTSYKWGRLSDDMFTTFLRQPHLRRSPFLTSGPEAANATDVINRYLVDGRYRPGTLAPLARRLGVGLLVIRNDLDWQAMGAPRPAQLQHLRTDPALQRTMTFGGRGENVYATGDRSLAGYYEAGLPPIEVYRVSGAATARVDARPPLLMAGDAEGLLPLARFGVLDALGPVRYTADLAPDAMADLLEQGSRAVITDTNRRRASAATATGDSASPTLPPDAAQAAGGLGKSPASQSVAVYTDATSIEASRYGTAFQGFQPWLRPANAFDGDPRTAWQVGGLGNPVGDWIRVELATATSIDSIRLTAPPIPAFGRTVSAVDVELSDGTVIPVTMKGGVGEAAFTPRPVDSVRVTIRGVTGRGLGTVGLAEIELPGVDAAEVIRAPHDVIDAAQRDPRLARALRDAGITYQFVRQAGRFPQDEELVVRRAFRSPAAADDTVSGVMRINFDTPDSTLDRLLGGDVGAFGSGRYVGDPVNRGRLAVDGRADTAWHATPSEGERLTVRFPARTVTFVDVRVPVDPRHSPITSIAVDIDGQTHPVPVVAPAVCAGQAPPDRVVNPGCLGTARLVLPRPVRATSLVVRVTGITKRITEFLTGRPIGIAEVSVDGGLPPSDPPGDAAVASACQDDLLDIDGRDVPIAVTGTVDDLLKGRAMAYASCGTTRLQAGDHLLVSSADVLVDEVVVQPPTLAPLPAPNAASRVREVLREPTRMRLEVEAPAGGALISGISGGPGWAATVDGAPARMVTADMQGAVLLPAGSHVVDMRYTRQRTYEVAQGITVVSLGCCLWLVRRRRSADSPG